ncbi:Down syndrome cell adhesion molecule-like protein 1 homolog [Takifugu rubripes]|uniref:Down syndrome cell adhesion molecule-like protein 1 homolog n=1 Tax=Takifugu rubripes TaxID=31033 RepID=UPI001145ABFE|nr:Down syndrome cell adhesion molecule-like protein 1 homolog [Takifugu rubripes]
MILWGRLPTLPCILPLALLSCATAGSIIATVGTDVTLTCKYDAQHYGKLPVCWGRGAIPSRGCANEVIKSDGTSVSSRLSERYLLLGNLEEGDVSLTIRQVEEEDSGMYGCRVEIPGWFNDHKHQITLSVVAARPGPLTVETREVRERSLKVQWTPAFDGGRPVTSYRVDLKSKQASWDTAVITQILNPDLTHLTLVDLHPAKSYNLRMFATNSVGTSHSSNVLTITTKEAAPEGPPLDMQLQGLTAHSIRVTWKPPKPDLTNGVLRSYVISYREYDKQFGRWQRLSVSATREVESIVLSNLKPSTQYGVLVQAKTNAGVGPASTGPLCSTLDELQTMSTPPPTWIHGTTPSGHLERAPTRVPVTAATVWGDSDSTTRGTSVPPDPPVVELKEVKDNMFSLAWTPGFEGDSPIVGFILEYKALNASWDSTKTVVEFGPNQTDATILEMNPSTYNVRIFARNSLGTSNASNVLTITTTKTDLHMDIFETTASTDSRAAASVEESHKGHVAVVVVPVVLVVLIAAILATWQLRRMKQNRGSLTMWLRGGAIRYRGSEPLQEL